MMKDDLDQKQHLTREQYQNNKNNYFTSSFEQRDQIEEVKSRHLAKILNKIILILIILIILVFLILIFVNF